MLKKAWIGAALFASLGLASAAAQAVVLSSAPGDNSYAFSWGFGTEFHEVYGNGTIAVIDGWGSNRLTLEITLNNTSLVLGQGGDRLVGFGFGIDPNATGVDFQDNPNDGGMTDANFVSTGAMVSNVPGVEICAWGGSNCSGGSSGGILAGESDTFRLRLDGTWGNEVTIDPIGLRYQTGYGSFTFSAPGNVPAPGPLALFLFGLAGLGVRRRFQSSRTTA